MKNKYLLAAVFCLWVIGCALMLSGCAGIGLGRPQLSPAAQKRQQEADAAIKELLVKRLEHCDIAGQTGAGIGGIAGTGTGFSAGLTFTCHAKPWGPEPAVAPSGP